VKRVGILILSLMLAGSAVPAAYAQRDQKPPQNGNRDDKKNPPGPIVREEKRGDGNNRGGDKRGGDKPQKPPRP